MKYHNMLDEQHIIAINNRNGETYMYGNPNKEGICTGPPIGKIVRNDNSFSLRFSSNSVYGVGSYLEIALDESLHSRPMHP